MLKKRQFRRKGQIGLGIVTRFYPPDFAATGQFVDELAIYLAHQDINIEVFTGQPGYAYSAASAKSIEAYPNRIVQRTVSSRILNDRIRGKAFNGFLFLIRSALHLIRSARHYDLVLYTTEPPYLTILGYLMYKIFGLNYICLVYDLYPDIAVKLNVIGSQHLLVRVWNWLNRQTWKHSKAVIVLSTTMRDRIIQHSPHLVGKVYIIPNWSDPSKIYPIPRDENWFVHQYNLQNFFTVLYSGNLGRCHDFETIMDAARRVAHLPIRFVFVGGGAGIPQCKELARIWGLTNCLFLPYQEKHFLSYSLAAADLSLVSIKAGMEGMIAPSKLYGVMAASRPIAAICDPNSYLSAIFQDARCGRVISNGDGVGLASFIQYLMSYPEEAKTMGECARQYCLRHHTLDVVGQQYLHLVYHSLAMHLNPEFYSCTAAQNPYCSVSFGSRKL